MTPEQLDRLVERRGVFLSTAYSMPHPRDDLDGWRKRWAQLVELIEEISALDAEPPPDP
jgi:hypothetical protein